MSFLAITRATLEKDIRLEWRSKDAINAMLFFALLVVVIFSFAFDPTAEESRRIAGGLVWVAFLFAAVVALNQTWARELRNQVLDAYRVSPAPANPLFLAKALGNFVFDQDWSLETQQGVMLEATFNGTKLTSTRYIPIHIYDQYQPRLAEPPELAQILDRIETASRELAP